jgi:hypothetical protein
MFRPNASAPGQSSTSERQGDSIRRSMLKIIVPGQDQEACRGSQVAR